MGVEQDRYVARLKALNPEYYREWKRGWERLRAMDIRITSLEKEFFSSGMNVETYLSRYCGVEVASGLRIIDIHWYEGIDLGPQFDSAVFGGKMQVWRQTIEEISQRLDIKSLDWRIRVYGIDGTLPGRLGYVIRVTNLAEVCGCEKRRFAECLKMIRRSV